MWVFGTYVRGVKCIVRTHHTSYLSVILHGKYGRLWALLSVIHVEPNGTIMQVIKRIFATSNRDQCVIFGMICWEYSTDGTNGFRRRSLCLLLEWKIWRWTCWQIKTELGKMKGKGKLSNIPTLIHGVNHLWNGLR